MGSQQLSVTSLKCMQNTDNCIKPTSVHLQFVLLHSCTFQHQGLILMAKCYILPEAKGIWIIEELRTVAIIGL